MKQIHLPLPLLGIVALGIGANCTRQTPAASQISPPTSQPAAQPAARQTTRALQRSLACEPVQTKDDDEKVVYSIGDQRIEVPGLQFAEMDEWATLVAYPLDADSILVTVRVEHGGYSETEGSSILWQVACARPDATHVFLEDPKADFGHGVSVGGTHLLFSAAGAVMALDLATLERRQLIERAPLGPYGCWGLGEPDDGEKLLAEDVVIGALPDGSVEIDRGGPCGFEADWEGVLWILRDPLGKAELVRESPIRTVATDPAGTLWIGNAAEVEPSARLQTFGGVWRSKDGGDSWRQVKIAEMECGAVGVYADDRRKGHVLVLEDDCTTGPAEACESGCGAFMTRDDGRTWRSLLSEEMSERQQWSMIRPQRGRLDHLRADFEDAAYESADAGVHWKEIPLTDEQLETQMDRVRAFGSPGSATHDGVRYTATRDGLAREIDGTRTIVFRTADHLAEVCDPLDLKACEQECADGDDISCVLAKRHAKTANARVRCEAKDAAGCAELGLWYLTAANQRTYVDELVGPLDLRAEEILEEACSWKAANAACITLAQLRWAWKLRTVSDGSYDPPTPTPERSAETEYDAIARLVHDPCVGGNGTACLIESEIMELRLDDDADEDLAADLARRACKLGVRDACDRTR